MNLILLATLLGAPQQSASTPLLQIVSVKALPADGTPRGCSVLLANLHSASAVAWILEQRSRQSTVVHGETSCEDPARTFEVAAVLYADGTFAGNVDRLNTGVLQRRREKAAGLRELVTLLTNAQERPMNEGTPVEQLRDSKAFVKDDIGQPDET